VIILAVCGSLRKASYTRLSLNALAAVAPADFALEVVGLDDIPMFNEDVFDATGYPAPVVALRAAIAAADGVIFGTPEYHHSIPGVLKNAIDWAGGKPPVLAGKPVAIVSASPSVMGGCCAQYHLRAVLQALDVPVMAKPEAFVGQADRKFDPAGRLTDEKTAATLAALLAAFREWIVRWQAAALAPTAR